MGRGRGLPGASMTPPSTQHPHCGAPRHLDLSPRGTQGQRWHRTAAKGSPGLPLNKNHHGGVPPVTPQAGGGAGTAQNCKPPIPSQQLFHLGLFTLSPNDTRVQGALKALAPAQSPQHTVCTPGKGSGRSWERGSTQGTERAQR